MGGGACSSPSLVSSSSLDDQTIVRLAEEKIRVKTIALGLRVTEFFHDFDRLRSGYVTASQFKRSVRPSVTRSSVHVAFSDAWTRTFVCNCRRRRSVFSSANTT